MTITQSPDWIDGIDGPTCHHGGYVLKNRAKTENGLVNTSNTLALFPATCSDAECSNSACAIEEIVHHLSNLLLSIIEVNTSRSLIVWKVEDIHHTQDDMKKNGKQVKDNSRTITTRITVHCRQTTYRDVKSRSRRAPSSLINGMGQKIATARATARCQAWFQS